MLYTKQEIAMIRALVAIMVTFASTFAPQVAWGRADDKAASKDVAPAQGSPNPMGTPLEDAQTPERVNVESIKQKYWARGDENELGVVQNRLYSKEHKFELGVFGGVVATDPFLTVNSLGGSLGYHFSEYWALHLIGWKDFSRGSAAFETFQQGIQAQQGVPAIPDTNFPKAYYGGEVRGSLLYGKLSVIGKAIIYYDFHVLAGVGLTNTETGNDFTGSLGVGQQVFLSKTMSLLVDYRFMAYHEQLLNKSSITNPNSLGATRMDYTSAISLGVSFFLDLTKKPSTAEQK